MNWKRFWLAALVVYVVHQIAHLIIHEVLLTGRYAEIPAIGSFQQQWVLWITAVVFSFFFVFMFAKGYEARGLMEGVRYGFYIAMLLKFVTSFNQYVIYGIPYSLVWYWFILGLIQMILCGIVAALIYKPKEATA